MKRLVFAFSFIGLSLALSTGAAAVAATEAITVSCHAEYGLTAVRLPVAATSDVFAMRSVNLGDRFMFKAQLLQERAKLKTFVYELRSHAPTLIHASEHLLSQQRCANLPVGLGLNKVYSSDLEREMFFQCFAQCE